MRTIEELPTINPFNDRAEGRVIGWISGGIASAIACKIALETYDNVELIFCDTNLEHPDTFRFIDDYEKMLGVKVKIIKSKRFSDPEQVWRKYLGMNFAHGAPCSTALKKEVRIIEQELDTDFGQIFGFDYCKKEMKRARNMLVNNPDLNPIFPLIAKQITREMLFDELKKLRIEPPKAYNHFLNNNCIGDFNSPQGGCVQGGVGYWQKIKELFPKKFNYMANIEHELSSLKYIKFKEEDRLDEFNVVTICKDQRNGKKGNRLFLKHNPAFPEVETIDVIRGKQPLTAFECNGFCNTIQGDFLNG